MGVMQGAVLTGAVATGLVVIERVRRRGSADAVREDVTNMGETMADQAGKAAGLMGRTSGRVLGQGARVAEDIGDRSADLVGSAGHAVAKGAGAAVGAYAGALDRMVPFGRGDEDETDDQPKKTATTARARRSASRSERTSSAKAH